MATVSCGPLIAAETGVKYTSGTCGIEFQLPANWSVTPSHQWANPLEGTPRCSLKLQPNNLKKLIADGNGMDLYTTWISVFDEDFSVQLLRGGYFERKDGKWFVLGRMEMEGPADDVKGNGGWGVQGTAAVGCYAEHGGYEGICESPRAFIGNHMRHSAYIEGGSQSEAVLGMILKTFRFRQS
jgi:hypothetical protein